MKKLLALVLTFTFILSSYAFAEYPVKDVRTWKKTGEQTTLSTDYKTGVERLAYTIQRTKGVPVSIEYVQIQNSDKGETRYKIRLNCDKSWINGNWIVDVVPYTAENMNIQTAKTYNKDYNFWYVVYDNAMHPLGVAWARYGKCNACQQY